MDITKIETWEDVARALAAKLERQYGIREGSYEIHMSRQLRRGEMEIHGGPKVQIVLLFPCDPARIRPQITSAFSLMQRRKLHTPLEIATRAFFKEGRKWLRAKLGDDDSDVVMDLIPRARITVQTTTTTVYRDTVTGEAITVSHEEPEEHFRQHSMDAWKQLSRIVRDKHDDDDATEERGITETPELDQARNGLAQG